MRAPSYGWLLHLTQPDHIEPNSRGGYINSSKGSNVVMLIWVRTLWASRINRDLNKILQRSDPGSASSLVPWDRRKLVPTTTEESERCKDAPTWGHPSLGTRVPCRNPTEQNQHLFEGELRNLTPPSYYIHEVADSNRYHIEEVRILV